jgi:hypothetical protein
MVETRSGSMRSTGSPVGNADAPKGVGQCQVGEADAVREARGGNGAIRKDATRWGYSN